MSQLLFQKAALFALMLVTPLLTAHNQFAIAQSATVDFESIPLDSQFGSSNGDSPGDIIFTQNTIDVGVDNFTRSGANGPFDSFGTATIGGFSGSSFPTTPATLVNINLVFDFTNLGFPVNRVTFESADFGGPVNLGVNGVTIELGSLALVPDTLNGVDASFDALPMSSITSGTLILSSSSQAIQSIAIGGSELGIDNVNAAFIPEPASFFIMASIASLGLLTHRRSA